MGNVGSAIAPSEVMIENFGNTTLTIATFASTAGSSEHIINWQGAGNIWNSSLHSIVGYWFHATKHPEQTNEGVDVSLLSVANGQFKFTSGEKQKEGKLYVLSLT